LLLAGSLFKGVEKTQVDVKDAVQAMVTADQTVSLTFDDAMAAKLLGVPADAVARNLIIIYSYGDFRAATSVKRSSDVDKVPIEISRENSLPPNKVAAFINYGKTTLDEAKTAPLKIENALIAPVPPESHGWLVALCTFGFMAFFAMGPGVCVWLALSELMPTRIRSNGMSVALLINQTVSTVIAAFFLPTVGKYGYSTLFFIFAGTTVIYFITAAFFLPETKGKTLEEIEAHFEGKKR